ncbi:MAG: DUF4258 domain-containing protein [Candidatus Aenigmarchaeota archaeon]|nr:DUF4258 domain-containing protein [Candidatus Aenigmarchaeota archaeon]
MRIIYTDHARERLEGRIIRKEWVEETLKNPDRLIDAEYGRKQAIKRINGQEISVIYVMENDNIIVITVFWGE